MCLFSDPRSLRDGRDPVDRMESGLGVHPAACADGWAMLGPVDR